MGRIHQDANFPVQTARPTCGLSVTQPEIRRFLSVNIASADARGEKAS
jgi:hypothetical protein